ncbi:MAG TPA: threonine/serine dehydratase [Steroidobacteraceae bacterium]|nr:threonine/serine dehydratase [Steroidobacteraceae bacterium]
MPVSSSTHVSMPTTDRRTGAVHFDDIVAARRLLAKRLTPTPLVSHPLLSQRLGCQAAVKLENAQALGSFKVRGGLNLLATLAPAERERGLVTATRGNHGQSLAHAAQLFKVRCVVFVPEANNPDKNAAMAALGAEVHVSGHDFDSAWSAAETFAARSGALPVHPSREPALIAGYGTVATEMLEQARQPFDAVFVPVGGGSLAAGMGLVLKALSPHTKLIGVQASSAPALCRAFHTGELREYPVAETIADGLASRIPSPDTVAILRDTLDDMVEVGEAEIHAAIRCYADTLHQLAEGAGAAALAGALRLRRRIAGQRVGLVLSGGNITSSALLSVLHGDPVPAAQPSPISHALSSMDYGVKP